MEKNPSLLSEARVILGEDSNSIDHSNLVVLLSTQIQNSQNPDKLIELLLETLQEDSLNHLTKATVLQEVLNSEIDLLRTRKSKKALEVLERVIPSIDCCLDGIRDRVSNTLQKTISEKLTSLVKQIIEGNFSERIKLCATILAKRNSELVRIHYPICKLKIGQLEVLKNRSEALPEVLMQCFDLVKELRVSYQDPLFVVFYNTFVYYSEQDSLDFCKFEEQIRTFSVCLSKNQLKKLREKYISVCHKRHLCPKPSVLETCNSKPPKPKTSKQKVVQIKACILEQVEKGVPVNTLEVSDELKEITSFHGSREVFKYLDLIIGQCKPTEPNVKTIKLLQKACFQAGIFDKYEENAIKNKVQAKNQNERKNKLKHKNKFEVKTRRKENRLKQTQELQTKTQETDQAVISQIPEYTKIGEEALHLIKQSVPKDFAFIERITEEINTQVKQICASACLEVTGSASYGTWILNTNIDLTIRNVQNQEFLSQLLPALKHLGSVSRTYGYLVLEPQGFSFKMLISADHVHERELSVLLKKYTCLDPKVNELILFTKLWAKKLGLSGGKYPSGFVWTIMTLHFLRVEGVVSETPAVQEEWKGFPLGPLILLLFQYLEHQVSLESTKVATIGGFVEAEDKGSFRVQHPVTGEVSPGVSFPEKEEISLKLRKFCTQALDGVPVESVINL